MTWPLIALAAGSVLGGWLGVPKLWTIFGGAFRLFPRWLAPMFALAGSETEHPASTEWSLMILSVAWPRRNFAGLLSLLEACGHSGSHSGALPAAAHRAL